MSKAQIKPTHTPFLEMLKTYGDMTRSALLERIPADEPYEHLYGPMRAFIENSGKGLRPALLLATCSAFDGRHEDALPSAAVIELLHNAFLIHDDIEDVSDFRRGQPCLHHELGVPLAINMGDAMQAMALRLLRADMGQLDPETTIRVLAEFDHLLRESIEGQALELGMIRNNALDIEPEDYLLMTLKKTCWYSFIQPCRIGALIARPSDVATGKLNLDDFNRFGFYLGAAFQIQDDVLNLIGSKQKYGKEIGGDIYEGKRTLMLARLAKLSGAKERKQLSAFLEKPRQIRSPEEIEWVLEQMHAHDCISYAQKASRSLLAAAQLEFQSLFSDANEQDRHFFTECMEYMVLREV